MNPDECKQVLLTGTEKINPMLNPLGYLFEISEAGISSAGPFASGFYSKGDKAIGLIYRARIGLGAVIYQYRQSYILHSDLMQYLGKYDVSKLKYSDRKFASFSKEEKDPFEALAYDIQNFAIGFLNNNDSEFESVLQQISLSKKAKGDRKQFVRNLVSAFIGSIIHGTLVGGALAGIFENLFLGILVGFGISLMIIILTLRNEKSKR